MYSRCIFCHRPLGQNGVIRDFDVGRRIAFEPKKGRLWVVCSACDGWCLTPIEKRSEVVRECERLVKAATGGIATLHRVSPSLELIRVGAGQRELDLWRYGRLAVSRRFRGAARECGLLVLRVAPGLAPFNALMSATSDGALWGYGLLTVAAAIGGGMIANRFDRSTLRRPIGVYHNGDQWEPLLFTHATSAQLNVIDWEPGWRVQLDAPMYYYRDDGELIYDAITASLDAATSLTVLRAIMPRLDRFGASRRRQRERSNSACFSKIRPMTR